MDRICLSNHVGDARTIWSDLWVFLNFRLRGNDSMTGASGFRLRESDGMKKAGESDDFSFHPCSYRQSFRAGGNPADIVALPTI
jgi:hypothetical protein